MTNSRPRHNIPPVPPSPAPLPRSFYARDAETVAKDLIGTILVHKVGRDVFRARIVETEAYVGCHDLACHAAKGRTKRTDIMWGPAGHAYVYLIYGMYDMLNIVTGEVDDAQAVLIRAAEPLDDWQVDLSGPGKLCRAMEITLADNRIDLTTSKKLYLLPRVGPPHEVTATKRIGVDYAGDWKDALLRFHDSTSPAVSRLPRPSRSRS